MTAACVLLHSLPRKAEIEQTPCSISLIFGRVACRYNYPSTKRAFSSFSWKSCVVVSKSVLLSSGKLMGKMNAHIPVWFLPTKYCQTCWNGMSCIEHANVFSPFRFFYNCSRGATNLIHLCAYSLFAYSSKMRHHQTLL